MALTSSQDALSWVTERLPLMTSILIIMLIGHSLATLTWQIIAPPPEPKTGEFRDQPATVTPKGDYKTRFDLLIAQIHLFGNALKDENQEEIIAPKTRLNLTLLGVYSTQSDEAIAIIASGGSNEKIYQIGDTIPGGAILKAVYPNRVLLERQSKMETLAFPRDAIKGVAFSKTSTRNAPSNAASPGTDRKLGNLRKEILKNPGRLGKMVQAKPVMRNGRFEGYQLSPSGNAKGNKALFRELGLEPGDVVTAVNDILLDRPEKGLNALQNLVNAPEVTVTLLRDGSEITIHHTVSQ